MSIFSPYLKLNHSGESFVMRQAHVVNLKTRPDWPFLLRQGRLLKILRVKFLTSTSFVVKKNMSGAPLDDEKVNQMSAVLMEQIKPDMKKRHEQGAALHHPQFAKYA